MKKQVLKAVTMLVSIIALAFMTAVVSNAQSRSRKLRANVPFDFGDKMLRAGEYNVGTITSNSNGGIMVRSSDSRQNAIRLAHNVQANAPKNPANNNPAQAETVTIYAELQ